MLKYWFKVLGHFFIGFGLALSIHDYILECIDPWRWMPHGFWFGILSNIIGWILLSWKDLRSIYRRIVE